MLYACTGFNWKLCVTIFLLLETVGVAFLKPRVYKKFADTIVETGAKTFLVAVLVVGLYSDSLSNVLAEGDAIPANNAYCNNFPESGGGLFGVNCAEVDACVLQDSQCVPRPITVSVGLFEHIMYGMPGVAPFFLSKMCNRRKSSKKKKKPNTTSPDHSDEPPAAGTFVMRARFVSLVEEDEEDVSDVPNHALDQDQSAQQDESSTSSLNPAVDPSAAASREPRWKRTWSADHNRPYWTDMVSGQPTWIEPEGLDPQQSGEGNTGLGSAATAPAPTLALVVATTPDWEEDYSEEFERTYWRNIVTRETTWHRPQQTATQVRWDRRGHLFPYFHTLSDQESHMKYFTHEVVTG
jgi:hypothetical protein